MNDFETWLRQVCFKPPTKEAYDLAKAAWQASAAETAKDMAVLAEAVIYHLSGIKTEMCVEACEIARKFIDKGENK